MSEKSNRSGSRTYVMLTSGLTPPAATDLPQRTENGHFPQWFTTSSFTLRRTTGALVRKSSGKAAEIALLVAQPLLNADAVNREQLFVVVNHVCGSLLVVQYSHVGASCRSAGPFPCSSSDYDE
jgi:hypothetical protein